MRMSAMNTISVDAYLADGCGRCEHYRTPQCKVHRWTEALVELRSSLVGSGLTEEMKWGSPCYTLNGKNVVMLVSRKDYCALSFIKGALLTDDDGALEPLGPNSQAVRLLKFTSGQEVRARRPLVETLVKAAIKAEAEGAKVAFRGSPEPLPAELQARLEAEPALKIAFDSLTPGRRRSYVLHVSGAKQSKTREKRVERCIPKILAGRGFNERG